MLLEDRAGGCVGVWPGPNTGLLAGMAGGQGLLPGQGGGQLEALGLTFWHRGPIQAGRQASGEGRMGAEC